MSAVTEVAHALNQLLVCDWDGDLFGLSGRAGGVTYEPRGLLGGGEGGGCGVGVSGGWG